MWFAASPRFSELWNLWSIITCPILFLVCFYERSGRARRSLWRVGEYRAVSAALRAPDGPPDGCGAPVGLQTPPLPDRPPALTVYFRTVGSNEFQPRAAETKNRSPGFINICAQSLHTLTGVCFLLSLSLQSLIMIWIDTRALWFRTESRNVTEF